MAWQSEACLWDVAYRVVTDLMFALIVDVTTRCHSLIFRLWVCSLCFVFGCEDETQDLDHEYWLDKCVLTELHPQPSEVIHSHLHTCTVILVTCLSKQEGGSHHKAGAKGCAISYFAILQHCAIPLPPCA